METPSTYPCWYKVHSTPSPAPSAISAQEIFWFQALFIWKHILINRRDHLLPFREIHSLSKAAQSLITIGQMGVQAYRCRGSNPHAGVKIMLWVRISLLHEPVIPQRRFWKEAKHFPCRFPSAPDHPRNAKSPNQVTLQAFSLPWAGTLSYGMGSIKNWKIPERIAAPKWSGCVTLRPGTPAD